jgi:Flp pilus assembly protein TadD
VACRRSALHAYPERSVAKVCHRHSPAPDLVTGRFPEDAFLHFNRAVVLDELKRYDAAVEAYGRCIELDPTHADAHFNLVWLSEIRGDKQGPVRYLSAYRRPIG